MDANFSILFMIDLYKDNHVHAWICACVLVCVHLLNFSLKTSPEKLLTGLLPNFVVVFL